MSEATSSYPPIRNAAVVGFGTVSPGIVASWLLEGIHVKVYEKNDTAMAKGKKALAAELQALVDNHVIGERDRDAALKWVTYTNTIEEAVRDADLAVEAVTENKDIKRKALQEMKAAMPAGATLATNTSSFTLGELTRNDDGAAIEGLENLGLYHVGLPAHLTQYVEVGSNDVDTSLRLRAFVGKLDSRTFPKSPVVVDTAANRPGHVWNILQADINSAALALLQQWGTVDGEINEEAVDKAAADINKAMHYLGTDWAATAEPLSYLGTGKYGENNWLHAHNDTIVPLKDRAKEAYDILQASTQTLALVLMQEHGEIKGVSHDAINRSMRFLGTRWAGTPVPLMAMNGGGVAVHGTLMHNIVPTLPNGEQRLARFQWFLAEDVSEDIPADLRSIYDATEANMGKLPNAEKRLAAVSHFLMEKGTEPKDIDPKAPFTRPTTQTEEQLLADIGTRAAGLIDTMRMAGMMQPADNVAAAGAEVGSPDTSRARA